MAKICWTVSEGSLLLLLRGSETWFNSMKAGVITSRCTIFWQPWCIHCSFSSGYAEWEMKRLLRFYFYSLTFRHVSLILKRARIIRTNMCFYSTLLTFQHTNAFRISILKKKDSRLLIKSSIWFCRGICEITESLNKKTHLILFHIKCFMSVFLH